MRTARARLARLETADGLVVASGPVGKVYEVDLDRVIRNFPMRHVSGRQHAKDVIVGLDGKHWVLLPLELLEVEVPQGFAEEAPRGKSN